MKKITKFLIASVSVAVLSVFTAASVWGDVVTMSYSGSTTTNMTGNNDAAQLGLNVTNWSVVGAKAGSSNLPGLNKDGTIRLYAGGTGQSGNGSTITVSCLAQGYSITSITLSVKSGTATVLVGNSEVTANKDGVYSINSTSFVVANHQASGQVQINSISITYSTGSSSGPSISADDVNIAYNATVGSIGYSLANGTGNVSATVTSGDWLTLGTVTDSTVPFTCSANTATTARTATVKLSFTDAADKVVTVTQAKAPAHLTTMDAIFSAATTAGGTATDVLVTFDNWVVSGVSTNGKNVFVTDGTKGFVIFSSSDMSDTYSAGSILSGTSVPCKIQLYNGFAEITDLNSSDLTIASGGTVSAEDIAMADLTGINTGVLVSYSNLTCNVDSSGNTTKYYLTDGTTTLQVFTSLYDFGTTLVNGKKYNISGIYQQFNNTKEILPRSANDIAASAVPTIVVSTNTLSGFSYMKGEGPSLVETLTVSGTSLSGNISLSLGDSSDYEMSLTENSGYTNSLTLTQADETTVYVRLKAGLNVDTSYKGTITLTSAGASNVSVSLSGSVTPLPIAPLPFTFDGGSSQIALTDGFTQDGLGADYGSSPKLKFDGTGDYVLLRFNERPGTLKFDIKGNSFSGGTFTVQTSTDGTTYTDLKAYDADDLSSTLSEEFDNLAADVRYIKWIYTSKSNGNVALGNISLAKYVAPAPEITLDSYSVEATADGAQGSIDVTYTSIDFDKGLSVVWYTDDTEETIVYSSPEWFYLAFKANYGLEYSISANTGEARAAYFKVHGKDAEDNDVYSGLVTVSQAAYVAPPVTLPFKLFTGDLAEGDYLIYYEGSAMNTTVSNDRLQYESVTPKNNVIETDKASIIWHIAPSGDYWTIYNAEANAYAAGTGAKNKAQMLADGTDDKAMWTVTASNGTYDFVNKANAAAKVNANLRNNINDNTNYGFACYATSTGGALSLYKLDIPESFTLTAGFCDGRYWATFYTSIADYNLPVGAKAYTMNADHQLYQLVASDPDTPGRTIPAGTAVIIIAESSSVTLQRADNVTAEEMEVGDNILEGSNTDIPREDVEGTPYVLNIMDGVLGFYPLADGRNIPAHKAYYIVSE